MKTWRLVSSLACASLVVLSPAFLLRSAATPASGSLVAITRHSNVYLIDTSGNAVRTVTTLGHDPEDGNPSYDRHVHYFYGSYAWSPDGEYLMLQRDQLNPNSEPIVSYILVSPSGAVERRFTRGSTYWAVDADRFLDLDSSQSGDGGTGVRITVASVTPAGARHVLWHYMQPAAGCGGAMPDPAGRLYWREVGFEGQRTTFQWSTSRHVAVYGYTCFGVGLKLTDTRTDTTHTLGNETNPQVGLGPKSEAVLSPTGALTAVGNAPDHPSGIIITAPYPGAHIRYIGPGELPAWSRDGRYLYYVRRVPSGTLKIRGLTANEATTTTYTTSIMRVRADGSDPVRLTAQDAYAFGPLQPTSDGRSLIFSKIDNDRNLSRHLSKGQVTPQLITLYGPRVNVERLDTMTGRWTIIANDAGNPQVQP